MRFFLIICIEIVISYGTYVTAQNGKFRIEGAIDKSFDGQLAILTVMDDYQTITHSSTSIINEGKFSFEGKEYLDNLSYIFIKDKYGSEIYSEINLLLEAGTIYIHFSDKNVRMRGTPLNDMLIEHLDSIRYFRTKIIKIEPKWENEIVISPDTELERLYYAQGECMMNFTKRNIRNPLGRALIMNHSGLGTIAWDIYIDKSERTFDEIFTFIDNEIRNHPRFMTYREKMKKAKEISLFIGKQIEDFTFLITGEQTKSLSDFIGKKDYVFIEFWASWCGPCLATIPKLKEIYEEYSDKLEIVSISLDTQEPVWLNALHTQNMPWPQLADPEGLNSDIAKTYGIRSIPFSLLLDKDGVIISQNYSPLSLTLFMENKCK
jgi:thiol-disulfide isomerase/thioredoxin